MKKLVIALAGLSFALTACTGTPGPSAESAPAPKPSVTAPKVTEAPKPAPKITESPKPVETVAPAPVVTQAVPEPVEAPVPAPMPVVTPEVAPAPMPTVDLAPATAYVAPENFAVDAPEYVESVPAPLPNAGSQMGGDLTPEQVEALKYPQTFAEPTPPGMVQAEDGSFVPQSFYEPTPPTTCPEGFAANSPVHGGGCIKIDPAWNLGEGAGGNYDYASDPANQS